MGNKPKVHKNKSKKSKQQKCTLYVDGMHCASCEILIEKKLLKDEDINSVDASLGEGQVDIFYDGKKPNTKELNEMFESSGYEFSENKFKKNNRPLLSFKEGALQINPKKLKTFNTLVFSFVALFILYLISRRLPLGQFHGDLSSDANIPFIIGAGFVAGLSSCAALTGGVLLSMTKKWNEVYIDSDQSIKKLTPFFMFNVSRLISFAILGGVLGLAGGIIGFSDNLAQTSLTSNPIVTFVIVIIAIIMTLLGLQLLGVKWAQRFKITMPSFLIRSAGNSENVEGKFVPLLVGFFTFFLPCAFTLSAQLAAFMSGSLLGGLKVMFFFALGTLPSLAVISFTSVKFYSKPHLTYVFNVISGIILIFFGLFNLNGILNVHNLYSFEDFRETVASTFGGKESIVSYDSQLEGAEQTIVTEANMYGYEPREITIRANTPTEWNITVEGSAGCAGVLLSEDLGINDYLILEDGDNIINLPALSSGRYKYTCGMGMFVGYIKVV